MMVSLDNGFVPSFSEVRSFFDRNWPIVRDKMTEVIWDLWADLDRMKNEAVEESAALQVTLQDTLADIKKVSSTIRMIAINAAVMAERPQEAAAGFRVIARQIKSLSEDIESSTGRAQETMTGLS